MKKFAITLCLAAIFALPVFAQTTWTTSKIGSYNGYDYELWSQDNAGTTSMVLNGDNGSGTNAKGGTFTATWSKTINVLFRSGRKFTNTSGQSVDGGGQGKTASAYGNISINFAATWSSTDNVKMLGVYGWAFFASGSVPTKQENGTSSSFSNQIEYYIIQDRGSYNSATQGTNSKKYGSATIDGIAYDFYVCDRIGQPMLTGSGNFKQYFSVPQSTNSHRTSGTISVSKHFEEWAKVGMKMDGPLYEVALKVESYTGSNSNANGNATVTKNILTIGGTSTTSSNSTGGTSSSSKASSSSAATQATTCPSANLVTYGTVPANPYTACFKYPGTKSEYLNKCYVCKVDNEGDGNTCASSWLWNSVTNVDDNLALGYWYKEVTCPATSSSSTAVSSSSKASSSSVASSSSTAVSSSSKASSSSAAVSSSSNTSSSSTAVSSSSKASSSSVAVSSSSSNAAAGQQECGEYKTSFCGGLAYGSVPDNSTTMPTEGNCLYIGDFSKIQPWLNSTVAINGLENTCGDEWGEVEGKCLFNTKPDPKDGGYYVFVKTGRINEYQGNGWQGIVAKAKPDCTTPSSSSTEGETPILKNRVPITYFSIQPQSNKALRIEVSSPSVVEIFNLKGNKVTSLNVSGSQTVRLSLPSGVYFAKAYGIKSVRFVLR